MNGYQIEGPQMALVIATATCAGHIGWARRSESEARGNARLIAAAPELLDALRSALSWITVLTETSATHAEGMRETEHKRAYLCDELRAAIARARGEG